MTCQGDHIGLTDEITEVLDCSARSVIHCVIRLARAVKIVFCDCYVSEIALSYRLV